MSIDDDMILCISNSTRDQCEKQDKLTVETHIWLTSTIAYAHHSYPVSILNITRGEAASPTLYWISTMLEAKVMTNLFKCAQYERKE